MRAITVSEVVYLNMIVSSPTIVIHERQLTRVVAKLKNQLKLHNMNQHMLMWCCCLKHIYTLVCRSVTEMPTNTDYTCGSLVEFSAHFNTHVSKFGWNFNQISTPMVEVWLKLQPNFDPPPCRNFNPFKLKLRHPVLHYLHCKTSSLASNFDTSGYRNFNRWGSKFGWNFDQISTPVANNWMLTHYKTTNFHVKTTAVLLMSVDVLQLQMLSTALLHSRHTHVLSWIEVWVHVSWLVPSCTLTYTQMYCTI